MATRILFVDDDLRVTEALRRSLRKEASWEILTVNSPLEALDVLRQQTVDIVVSDERMPGMSGCEFLSLVAQHHPDVMRIILTGEARLDAAIRAINEAGIFRFLTKPCHTDEMVACLGDAIAAKAARLVASERRTESVETPELGALGAAVDRALEQLWVEFQPIVSSSRRQVIGYEALLRIDPVTFSGPHAMLAAADRMGRTPAIDERVFERVAAAAIDAPPEALLFVNIHPATLEQPTLFADDNPLAPLAHRTVLEITDRSSLENVTGLDGKIAALREIGFRIAIDDLGSGYSGLTALVQMRPDFVKFDRVFVAGIHTSTTRAKLIQSIDGICRELGIQTIAEGVESEGDERALVALGCDLLQGHHFAYPAKGFTELALPPRNW